MLPAVGLRLVRSRLVGLAASVVTPVRHIALGTPPVRLGEARLREARLREAGLGPA
jgi:hypothetical protein